MANSKKTIYVGGLSNEVDIQAIKSIFSPFGDILNVTLPLDYKTPDHKGFAFVEFTSADDAQDAIDNMDNGEILGKTIRVSLANPTKIRDGSSRPIWSDEDYLKKYVAGEKEDGNEGTVVIPMNQEE